MNLNFNNYFINFLSFPSVQMIFCNISFYEPNSVISCLEKFFSNDTSFTLVFVSFIKRVVESVWSKIFLLFNQVM